ncbi:MAG: tRNA (adenosine(37)-N6)-threonylcarbamoyltransferase complex ATPase subunit type 1 TsaE [Chitinophagaceae bacterium]|jgi:tRNA threonylcarbamoyladenosine biosynthesis protein TsaE|nr:tRNA (adenosine(37)-N6)-threonylcarbamoyltransferase complex ATPase subunit type 1 TsaE [Chitinophagaceae bacterium]
MEWLTTIDNLEKTAALFWEALKKYRVFVFHGEMGAGKTTFIHALCAHKKIKDAFSSPTFSLINEYRYVDGEEEKIIYHMDLYRVKTEEEAVQAGIEDCLFSKHICLVEWPEKIPHLLPDETCHAFIEITGPETRRIRIADK